MYVDLSIRAIANEERLYLAFPIPGNDVIHVIDPDVDVVNAVFIELAIFWCLQ